MACLIILILKLLGATLKCELPASVSAATALPRCERPRSKPTAEGHRACHAPACSRSPQIGAAQTRGQNSAKSMSEESELATFYLSDHGPHPTPQVFEGKQVHGPCPTLRDTVAQCGRGQMWWSLDKEYQRVKSGKNAWWCLVLCSWQIVQSLLTSLAAGGGPARAQDARALRGLNAKQRFDTVKIVKPYQSFACESSPHQSTTRGWWFLISNLATHRISGFGQYSLECRPQIWFHGSSKQ